MPCLHLSEFITLSSIVVFSFRFFYIIFCFAPLGTNLAKLPQSPPLVSTGSKYIYGGLIYGDTREEVLSKLRKQGFIQIYEQRDEGVIRCAVRWDGLRYELVCKLIDDKLNLCLIEGNKGWQDFHFNEVVTEEWKKLRERITETYGKPEKSRAFPEIFEIPINDLGGVVTDIWNMEDRMLMLSVRKYETKDCCTDQILEFSCCTLLIKPKLKISSEE